MSQSLGDPHGDQVAGTDLFVSSYALQPVQRLLVEGDRQCFWGWPPNTDLHRLTLGKYSSKVVIGKLVPSDCFPFQSPPLRRSHFLRHLFDFFWLYTVPGNMLNVAVIPLRIQLPKLHRLKRAQVSAGFEAVTLNCFGDLDAHKGDGYSA